MEPRRLSKHEARTQGYRALTHPYGPSKLEQAMLNRVIGDQILAGADFVLVEGRRKQTSVWLRGILRYAQYKKILIKNKTGIGMSIRPSTP